jgi:hypothetical protein
MAGKGTPTKGGQTGEHLPQFRQEAGQVRVPPGDHPVQVHGGKDRPGSGQHDCLRAVGDGMVHLAAQRLAQHGVQGIDLAVPHGHHGHAVFVSGFDHWAASVMV